MLLLLLLCTYPSLSLSQALQGWCCFPQVTQERQFQEQQDAAQEGPARHQVSGLTGELLHGLISTFTGLTWLMEHIHSTDVSL
jgi:hypothetical protein